MMMYSTPVPVTKIGMGINIKLRFEQEDDNLHRLNQNKFEGFSKQ